MPNDLPSFSMLDGRVIGAFKVPEGVAAMLLKDGAWVPVPMALRVEADFMGRPLSAEETAALPPFSATS